MGSDKGSALGVSLLHLRLKSFVLLSEALSLIIQILSPLVVEILRLFQPATKLINPSLGSSLLVALVITLGPLQSLPPLSELLLESVLFGKSCSLVILECLTETVYQLLVLLLKLRLFEQHLLV